MRRKTSNRNAPIRPKQIQMIHIAKGQLGLNNDTYRDVLHAMFGAVSSKDLSAVQADELLDEFKKRGFKIVSRHPRPARRPKGKNVVHLASTQEIDKLNAVAALVKWKSRSGLRDFLSARMNITSVRTSREVYLAIEAVKKLFENQMKTAHGPDWWCGQFDDPAVMEYIRRHKPEEFR